MSDQLRSIFTRWQDLEERKAATSDDLKELFAEAKGNGFDPKALRLAFRLKVKADEPEREADKATRAMVETYLEQLEERSRARPAPARVETIKEIPALDATPAGGRGSPQGVVRHAGETAAQFGNASTGEGSPEALHVQANSPGENPAVPVIPYPGDDDPLGPDLPPYLVRHPAASMERG